MDILFSLYLPFFSQSNQYMPFLPLFLQSSLFAKQYQFMSFYMFVFIITLCLYLIQTVCSLTFLGYNHPRIIKVLTDPDNLVSMQRIINSLTIFIFGDPTRKVRFGHKPYNFMM